MAALAVPATLGVFEVQGDDDWVHWAVADGDTLSLIPRHRATLLDQAMEGCLRWLPALVFACAVAAVSSWLMFATGVAFIVSCTLLVASVVAMVITGIGLYEHAAILLENHRYGEMILTSEAALRRARAQARERPAPAAPMYESDDPAEDEDEDKAEREDFDPFPPRRPRARGRKKRRARHGR
ncbi:hypothetical protein [Lysobacter sp. CA199]|uniref:hypothetical protein n=1 Tax=Lysobacter sp. CA199 TaxID=3455608 RepID=UPI003F8D09BC